MPAQPPIAVRRHYSELSEKDTAAVVGTVADLIVNYLKTSGFAEPVSSEARATREGDAGAPEVHV